MKIIITFLLVVSGNLHVSARGCVPPHSDYTWSSMGNLHYTITFRNVEWKNAQSACNEIQPGKATIAHAKSEIEWQFIKKVLAPGWYWFKNQNISILEKDIRYFNYGQKARVTRRNIANENCLIYVHRGETNTDMFCGFFWARVLCEVRC